MVRKAFSFIELVVSIVVIGIVFMTVPLILMESEKSYAFSIQQEGVMAGVTSMVNILGHRWDQADTNETLNGGFAKVCDVTGGAGDLNRTSLTSNRRKGHFKGEYRRKFFDYTYLLNGSGLTFATYPPGPEAGEGNVRNDIDDFNGAHYSMSCTALTDYKYNYEINVSVFYSTDNFDYTDTEMSLSMPNTDAGTSTNIKTVRVTLTSREGVIRLYAFSSNIGEYKILHRTFR